MSTDIQLIYRLSDNGYPKTKFDFATKQVCLNNFLSRFRWKFSTVYLFIDTTNLQTNTLNWVTDVVDSEASVFGIQAKIQMIDGGSSAKSWQIVKNFALESFSDNQCVYFVEDDYLHRKGSDDALIEGLGFADYVSLYDHADKYIPAAAGGNQFIDEDGGEVTKVFRTPTSHWKLTNSTTMTFATSIKTLREDASIWDKWTSGSHPNDFQCFLELREKGRSLVTPIPGFSTHCEPRWASPGIDWEKIVQYGF